MLGLGFWREREARDWVRVREGGLEGRRRERRRRR